MKILVLGSYGKSLIVFRGPLIKSLVDRGHVVIASAPDLAPDLADALIALGATPRELDLQRTSTNPLADLRYMFALRRLIREVRPDRILAYTMKPVIYGSLAGGRKTPVISMITGLGYGFAADTFRQRIVGPMVRALLRQALARNVAVIFQNPDDEHEFRSRGLIRPETRTLVVNGSGVDLAHFGAAPVPSSGSFLMIARLLVDKGVREFVSAARIVKKSHPQARFRLAGWLDENPRCIPAAELDAWKAEGVIEFLGYLDDVRPAIRDSAVYVLPSYREGTPRTSLEAMSVGRAIITTDVPGCRQTVEDGVNGLLIRVRDAEALADAMSRFLTGECSAESMGRESRRIAERKFDVNVVNRQIVECLALDGMEHR